MKKPQRKASAPGVEDQRRIKRLERICFVLSITILLVAIFGIGVSIRFCEVVGVLDFLTQRIDLIREQVDAISQCIQGIT